MERAQEGRGVGWLCEWRGVNRVTDMKARGVRFEVVQRAVMGGYLPWEGSAGTGEGETEVKETATQGGEESKEEVAPVSLSEQPIVAAGVEQGRAGDLARVCIGRSGEGAPAGRADAEQPCGSQYHETLRAAELCAKAVSEGQECRWGV